ncbi:MAG: glycosyltransferase family 39 protein [Nanoarchaeota archaeon]|nr:glycosyltransferase family 39 protein [Nanoarchaeota archaeon]
MEKKETISTQQIFKTFQSLNIYKLLFLLIILFLIIFRLYWFFKLGNQPLWWDEADYMNIARTWLGAGYWNLQDDVVRPILLPAVISLISIFTISELEEVFVRLFILFCSIVSVPLLYGIGKLFFNKRIALMSSFMLAVFWSVSFYSHRILADIPVMTLWLATIYFFFSAYFKDKSEKYFILPGILLGLAFLMKPVSSILVFAISIYLITTEKFKIFKDKKIILFFLVAFLMLIPLFFYQYFLYGSPLQFSKSSTLTNEYSMSYLSLHDVVQNSIKTLYPTFSSVFIFGAILVFFNLVSLKLFRKKSLNNKYYFLFLWLSIPVLFFVKLGVTYQMGMDLRYFFIFYPAIFLISAIGLNFLYLLISQYNKYISIILITIILLFGAYQNLSYTREAINLKKDSFIQLKLAGEFINQNTNSEDIIFLIEEQAEVTYYAQRKYINLGYNNSEEIMSELKKYKPKYFLISFFLSLGNDQRPIQFVFSNPEIFQPVQTYGPYIDPNQKIPFTTLFKINPGYY